MGAFGTGTFGLGNFGGGVVTPPMVSSPDAVFYSMENMGVASPMVKSPDAVVYSMENMGFAPPRIDVVHQQPTAWGMMPLFSTPPVYMLHDDAAAISYSMENMGPYGVGTYHQEVLDRTPVGFWCFDGNYQDSSGHGYTLNAAGSGGVFVDPIVVTERPTGKALDMGGIASYAYSSTPVAAVDAIHGAFSVAWVGLYLSTSVQGHVIGQISDVGDHFLVRYNPTLQQFLVIWHDGTAIRTHTLPTGAPINSIKAGAVVANGTKVALFIDGAKVSEVDQVSGPVAQAAGHYVCVGTDGSTNNRWQGTIDGVALFDYGLSDADVLDMATAAGRPS